MHSIHGVPFRKAERHGWEILIVDPEVPEVALEAASGLQPVGSGLEQGRVAGGFSRRQIRHRLQGQYLPATLPFDLKAQLPGRDPDEPLHLPIQDVGPQGAAPRFPDQFDGEGLVPHHDGRPATPAARRRRR